MNLALINHSSKSCIALIGMLSKISISIGALVLTCCFQFIAIPTALSQDLSNNRSVKALSLASSPYFTNGKNLRKSSGTIISSTLHILIAQNNVEKSLPISSVVSEHELESSLPTDHLLMTNNEIGIKLRVSDSETIVPILKNIGVRITGVNDTYNIIEGYMALSQVLALDKLPERGLLSVDVLYKPVSNIGITTTQADSVMETDKLRQLNPMFQGQGVKIGVLSDSYNNLSGEAMDIATGDLPGPANPFGNVIPITVIEDLVSGGIDEGRAMLQLIHDMAPGAELLFATALNGQQSFADNIQLLADQGCSVIVDDITYFAEPYFQDGIIAQAVDNVTNNDDVIYFSSAGNLADKSYEISNPQSIVPSLFNGTVADIDFDLSNNQDGLKQIVVGTGDRILIGMQWDDPFLTTSDVDSDLDIFLTDDPPTVVLAQGFEDNIANQTPFEVFEYTNNTGSPQTLNLIFNLFSGPLPGRIKIINFANDFIQEEYDTDSPTIIGHHAAGGAIAVGAIPFFSEIPESFTSHGPSTILFNEDGSLKPTEEVRQTPELSATDGTNTTFFSFDIPEDSDIFPNFFGTSAAAPHAAALAALIRQAHPTYNRDQVASLLIYNAKDVGPPGLDNITGNGFVSALSSCILPSLTTPSSFLADDVITRRLRTQNDITASGFIDAAEDFEFISGSSVVLEPTFEVQLNASLTVQIGGCLDVVH